MANSELLWSDGRSGQAGQIAGNLVLEDSARRFRETIRRRKGTTFVSSKHLYFGRARAHGAEEDWAKGIAHWFNLSPRQFGELTKEAREKKRKLFFVLITALPKEIHYWRIPSDVIGRILPRLPVKKSDKSCLLRIEKEGGRFVLEGEDITKHHQILRPDRRMAAALSQALADSRDSSRKSLTSSPSLGTATGGKTVDVRLQKIFQHGDELALTLPRQIAERAAVSVDTLVQMSICDGGILLQPVAIVPKLSKRDEEFVDDLYRRRQRVFEALGE